ncbi:MAG TPA: hypothetical protein VKY59_09205, partial [Spirillospora sp.]|nr:hypothetical protein [Spirillospora sp.]
LTSPSLERLYGLTFSPAKGLFLISPFLLLCVPGLIAMWRRGHQQRPLVVALALSIAALFAFYASSVMWWGGHTVGPRYLIPILPFMTLPIILTFAYLFRRVWGILLTGALLVISVIMVWVQTIAGQAWPPTDAFLLTIDLMNSSNTFIDYSLPLLLAGDVARNYGGILLGLDGLAGLLPLLIALLVTGIGVPYAMLQIIRSFDGKHRHTKLAATSETP